MSKYECNIKLSVLVLHFSREWSMSLGASDWRLATDTSTVKSYFGAMIIQRYFFIWSDGTPVPFIWGIDMQRFIWCVFLHGTDGAYVMVHICCTHTAASGLVHAMV